MTRPPRQRARQFDRLVVAPPQQAGPVDGNRNKQRLGLQKWRSGTLQPLRGRSGEVRPVAMLQSQNKSAPGAAIGENGPPPVLGPWRRETVVAERGDTVIFAIKCRTAGVADESAQKRHFPPARCAQPTRCFHKFGAKHALIRIDQ